MNSNQRKPNRREFLGSVSCTTAGALLGVGLLSTTQTIHGAQQQVTKTGTRQTFGPATECTPVIARFEKLQYGMWINFGTMSMTGEHYSKIRTSPLPPPEIYNPTQLDVDQWIATARKAGMRYAVLDSKGWHGFCLWDSKYTEYDVAASPVKTDVIDEFVRACRKYGIAPCLSFSFIDTEYERRTGRLIFDESDEQGKKQMTELLTNYGPITTMWFDGMGQGDFPEERVRRAYETVKSLQPDCLVVMHNTGPHNEPLRRWPTDVDQRGSKLPPEEGYNPQKKHDGKSYYIPAEVLKFVTDLAFRKGETWTPKPLTKLVDDYQSATTRGANVSMVVWPDRQGKLPGDQVDRLLELAEAIRKLEKK